MKEILDFISSKLLGKGDKFPIWNGQILNMINNFIFDSEKIRLCNSRRKILEEFYTRQIIKKKGKHF